MKALHSHTAGPFELAPQQEKAAVQPSQSLLYFSVNTGIA